LGVYDPNTGQPYRPPTNKSLLTPQGLAMIGSDLLVVDTGNSRILRFPPFSQWPAPSNDPSKQTSPEATAVIGQADFTTSQTHSGANGLSLPLHAVYSGSELFVADYGNNRVMVFPQAGPTASRILGQVNADANGPNIVDGKGLFLSGAINTPSGTTVVGGSVALDRRSEPLRLYVADTFNNRVLGFCDVRKTKPGDDPTLVIGQPDLSTTKPNFNASGSSETNDSNLKAPIGVAVDANGHLYVADWGNGRVLRFPEPCANPGGPQRANLVLGQSGFSATRQTSPGSTVMGEPYGLAFMPEGHLLVSDRAFNRVLRFDKPANGDFSNGQAAAAVFGQSDFFGSAPSNSSPSAPPDRMRDPRFIATDTSGRLYVADSNNRRVLVFAEVASAGSGTSAAFVLTRGLSNDSLGETHGIYVSPTTGEIWMTGLSDGRLYRYDEYRVLSLNPNPSANLRLTMATPGMGIALDEVGSLYISEQGNRISLYASPAVATDAAAFVSGGQLAPGMIATIWPVSAAGFRGTDVAGAAAIPLPRTLADTQVLVNGQPVPLFYVSGSQINFQVPNNVPQTGTIDLQVIRPSTGEILAAGAVAMRTAQPRFFLKETSGQAAAINNDDGSCNGEQQGGPSAACPGGTRKA
jgi:sugar lactone lactonase YvrE